MLHAASTFGVLHGFGLLLSGHFTAFLLAAGVLIYARVGLVTIDGSSYAVPLEEITSC